MNNAAEPLPQMLPASNLREAISRGISVPLNRAANEATAHALAFLLQKYKETEALAETKEEKEILWAFWAKITGPSEEVKL